MIPRKNSIPSQPAFSRQVREALKDPTDAPAVGPDPLGPVGGWVLQVAHCLAGRLCSVWADQLLPGFLSLNTILLTSDFLWATAFPQRSHLGGLS